MGVVGFGEEDPLAAVFGKKGGVVEVVWLSEGGSFEGIFTGGKSQFDQREVMIRGDVCLGILGDQGDQSTIKFEVKTG